MSKRKPRYLSRLLFLVVPAVLIFGGVAAFRTGPAAVIQIRPSMPGIGKNTPVEISIDEPVRGLSRLRVELVQGERVEILEERAHTPRAPWQFWGPRIPREDMVVPIGSETIKGLKEGEATIRVVADRAGAWLRRPEPSSEELTLSVKLRPPTLQVQSLHTYVSQGGSEAVVYRVGDTSVKDGVRAGDWWFPGYPLPGGGDRDRFALFSMPYDMQDASGIKLVALDDVGNEATASFVDRANVKPLRREEIRISDDFMQRVVQPILDQAPELEDQDGLLENYLHINGTLRQANSDTLKQLAEASPPEFYWSKKFVPMRNGQVMSSFAMRRTYTYNGNAVDQQDHLGFDLASTTHADIQASNDGVVVLAEYFGIYGNCVVIDHGYGLLSLYGHLSSISVETGQSVVLNETVGRSGQTGLAGGDHLHFTILLRGLPVNPQEWWDGHWIHDRLKLKLGAALPFER
jgi:murein DD-endopeptidase MepM/ murein hydrolase activator NlpD